MKKHFTSGLAFLVMCVGQVTAQYFNHDYSLKPEYKDQIVVTGTIDTPTGDIITVGSVPESSLVIDPNLVKHDVVVTKTDKKGNHIWTITYGEKNYDEQAHGVELTYDEGHVIVVGQSEIPTLSTTTNPSQRKNVLAFKINTTTAALVWANTYGSTKSDDVGYMIKKLSFNLTSTSKFPGLYTIVGTSRPVSGLDTSTKLYAVSIFDAGGMYWDRRYAGGIALGLIHNTPFTMTEMKNNNLMIAGTRFENNRPLNAFTMGISPFDGSITDKYIHYNIDLYGNVSGGAICRLTDSATGGYALAFSTQGGASASQSTPVNKITVMKLADSRKVLWTKYYWEPTTKANKGLSIFEYKGTKSPVDDYFSVFVGQETSATNYPGYLSVKSSNGAVNYFLKYNSKSYAQSHDGNAAVRAYNGYGYILKSKFQSLLVKNRGFSLARLNEEGKTYCVDKESIKELAVKAVEDSEAYYPNKHGVDKAKKLLLNKVSVSVSKCVTSTISAGKTSTGTSEVGMEDENVTVFPVPLTEGTNLSLNYTSEENKTVQVVIYNAIGAEVINKTIQLVEGTNTVEFEGERLSSGLNVVTISQNGNIEKTIKVLKK